MICRDEAQCATERDNNGEEFEEREGQVKKKYDERKQEVQSEEE